ncbi:hypothetical protein FHE73_17635 [Bacillus thuringiensis]|nr:hypothetical protein CGQ22_14665 [Bacillus sp. M13(2017)]QCY62463.1 hypothetical protein FHE73_17635 [Bacillus thuringiensis]
MLHILKQQYNLISSTRETLFSFLEEIPVEKLHSTVPNFGSGSIIKTHIYVADCYRYWLGSFAFKQKRACFEIQSKHALKIFYLTISISPSIPNSLSIIICITIRNGMFPLRLCLSWI